MTLYLLSRPRNGQGEAMRNSSQLHAALIDAASPAAAITAANALAAPLGVNNAFNNYTVTIAAATAQGGFVNSLFDGDAIGAPYYFAKGIGG